MTACESVAVELPAYMRGRLDAASAGSVERHLRDCPACQTELRELQGLDRLLDQFFPSMTPSPTFASTFANRLAAEIAAEEERSSGSFLSWIFRPWLLPLAAAAALALIVSQQLFDGGDGPIEIARPPETKPAVEVARRAEPERAVAKPAQRAEEKMVASPPKEMLERLDLFVDYAVIEDLETTQAPGRAG